MKTAVPSPPRRPNLRLKLKPKPRPPMIDIKQIKKLREKTGIAVGECRRALEAAGGDENRALEWLKAASAKVADKKSNRTLGAGVVASYIHSNGTLGALVELRSETDFVSKNQAFRDLAGELAMQVAAAAPAGPSWAEILAPIILATAAGLILTAKHLTKTVYLFLLLIVHRLALAVKNICHRIENRFSKLIRAVHGRGERSLMEKPRGAVSFFLEQIKIDKPR